MGRLRSRIYKDEKNISEGIRAKSDTSDARVLAMFGAEKKCNYEPYKYSDQETLLRDLVQRRSDLIKMSIAEKARLSSPESLNYKSSIKRMMKYLEKEIDHIDEEIIQAKKPLEKFDHQEKLLLSIPGVGQVTATTLLATAPELGKIENKQASALIGVAPYTRKSGTFKGKEFIQGGRPVPRRVLYMASLTAVRHNPKLKDFYQKLIKAGKRAKVALVAAMRKLIFFFANASKKIHSG
ncbi:MAG TPA: transposase [Candidatus Babeliales bacterium]|nr:transposase [Candidatus Babeliales bacterium]